MNRTFLACALMTLVMWSCKNEEPQPVTKEEALDFAYKIESSLRDGRHEVFDSLFHETVFSQKVAEGAGAKSDKSFLKGVRQGLRNMQLGKEILGSMKEQGTYELVNHYVKDNNYHLVFRLYAADGINYHDMELIKMDGRIHAADMYIYMNGETFSKTLSSVMATMFDYVKEKDKSAVDQYAWYMKEVKTLMAQQKYAEAKATLEKLPAEFQKEKLFRSLNLQISSQLGDEAYREALDEFELNYAADAGAQLALIDAYFLKKDYKKVLRAIDVVDSAVNHDPVLHYYRALAYSQMNDVANTVKCLETLQKEKPGFGDGMLELIANYVEMEDFD